MRTDHIFQHRWFSRRGVSLVELLTVVMIIGILSAVGVPKFATALSVQRAQTAARRIATDLDAVRFAARRSAQQQSITFNLANNSYTLTGVTNPDHPSAVNTVFLTDGAMQATLTSASFGGDAVLIYNGYGIPDSGGTIVLKNGVTTRTITVDATTGSATIQ